ncbi:Putative ribonuclease H protein At1g65750 [Linum perenne]
MFPVIKRRLEYRWAKARRIQVSDLANNFYMVRFSEEDDYQHALFDGPWKFFDYYITVACWSPDFNEDAPIQKIMTWVKLPKLPIQFFNQLAVERSGNHIGRTVRLDRMGIQLTQDLGRYLGIPIIHGRTTSSTFTEILVQMDSKLSGWKSKTLSLVGRVTLAQSVLAAIPAYAMQTSLLPIETCKEIDKRIRNFIWGSSDEGRKIHLVNWDQICTPKEAGGLGLRQARYLNLAYMTKLAFLCFQKPDLLWVRVLQGKYFKDSAEGLVPAHRSSQSNTWKGICQAWPTMMFGARAGIRDGFLTSFWSTR